MTESRSGADAAPPRPWYRERLMWMIVGIPTLTVVAGLTTVYIAYHGSDPVVFDDMRKEGLAIHADPARDRAAQAAGVNATVEVGPGRIRVELKSGTTPAPSMLHVILSHATRAEYDQLLALNRDAEGAYEAALPALAAGHWYLELTPSDRAWRLTGEFQGGTATLALAPRTTL